jgi:imidazolonepropionase-like amidohydrolase
MTSLRFLRASAGLAAAVATSSVLLASVGRTQLVSGEFLEVNTVPAAPEEQVVAVLGARLADRGRGPRARIAIPRGAEMFDAAGLTVLPGLVDAHFHAGPRPEIAPMFLRAGVNRDRLRIGRKRHQQTRALG